MPGLLAAGRAAADAAEAVTAHASTACRGQAPAARPRAARVRGPDAAEIGEPMPAPSHPLAASAGDRSMSSGASSGTGRGRNTRAPRQRQKHRLAAGEPLLGARRASDTQPMASTAARGFRRRLATRFWPRQTGTNRVSGCASSPAANPARGGGGRRDRARSRRRNSVVSSVFGNSHTVHRKSKRGLPQRVALPPRRVPRLI